MGEVNARILYWGAAGSGKLSNLKTIHAKLRADHRGEIEAHPTRIDPSVSYHALPIELGDVGGLRTRLRIETAPSTEEHAPTRRQLLDQVDGVVFVVDTQLEQLDANLASWAELREMLADYGRELADLPMVVQYNKRDLSDPFALEELHRKLELSGVAAFEAVATEGTGVLQTLTTISKRVVRTLRDRGPAHAAEALVTDPLEDSGPRADPVPTEGLAEELLEPESVGSELVLEDPAEGFAAEVAPEAEDVLDLEAIEATTTLAESTFEESFQAATTEATADALGGDLAEPAAEAPEGRFEIAQVGTARADGSRAVAVPIVLRDERGEERSLVLTVRLDPLEDA